MHNKLKDIFSDNTIELDIIIQFENNEACNKFDEALKIVWGEGKAVEVKGVTAIETFVRDGNAAYPLNEHKDIITNFIVAPSHDAISFNPKTKYGDRTISFRRYHTTKETIVETNENDVVYIKMRFPESPSTITFTFRVQPQFAKTTLDIIGSLDAAIALVDTFVDVDNAKESPGEYVFIDNAKDYLRAHELFYSRLHLLEQELKMTFEPKKISEPENDRKEIEELFLLLVEKKAIRLNGKLTANESTGITMQAGYPQPEIGNELSIMYLHENKFMVCGQEISVHTVSILFNAIVKQIEENDDGSKRILYDDTDSRPMYISYMGFKTIDEAEQERKIIMEHKELYVNALTLNEHMKDVMM